MTVRLPSAVLDEIHIEYEAGAPPARAFTPSLSRSRPNSGAPSSPSSPSPLRPRHYQEQYGPIENPHAFRIRLRVNDMELDQTVFRNPFLPSEYEEVLDPYVNHLANALWHFKRRTRYPGSSQLPQLHRRLQEYGREVLRQLGFDHDPLPSPGRASALQALRPNSTGCIIHISEREFGGDMVLRSVPSIHEVHFELAEGAPLPPALADARPLGYTVSVVREITVMRRRRMPTVMLGRMPYKRGDAATDLNSTARAIDDVERVPPLADAQQQGGTYHILLVVAREFIKAADGRPPKVDRAPPHLAQWPLMNALHRLGPDRMMLDVVRPGSVRDLKKHLQRRATEGIWFHLVHFDLHGSLNENKSDPDRAGLEPMLHFTKSSEDYSRGFPLERSPVVTVARVLSEFSIENVVLNACVSASTRYGRDANMCRLFTTEGKARYVLGMFPDANVMTVQRYLTEFYEALLHDRLDFETAAQLARQRLRQDATRLPPVTPLSSLSARASGIHPVGAAEPAAAPYSDDFICVQYTRLPRRMRRESRSLLSSLFSRCLSPLLPARHAQPIPPPLPHLPSSQASSIGAGLGWTYSSRQPPPSSGPLLFNKMDMPSLELEVLLTTPERIVYACDARQDHMLRTIDSMREIWRLTNLISESFWCDAEEAWTQVPQLRELKKVETRPSAHASLHHLSQSAQRLPHYLHPNNHHGQQEQQTRQQLQPRQRTYGQRPNMKRSAAAALPGTLLILENVDLVIGAEDKSAGEKAVSQENLRVFFDNLAPNQFLIVLSSKDTGWWDQQTAKTWTGSQTGHIWSHSRLYLRQQQQQNARAL